MFHILAKAISFSTIWVQKFFNFETLYILVILVLIQSSFIQLLLCLSVFPQ